VGEVVRFPGTCENEIQDAGIANPAPCQLSHDGRAVPLNNVIPLFSDDVYESVFWRSVVDWLDAPDFPKHPPPAFQQSLEEWNARHPPLRNPNRATDSC
jgi:hypothetical protein